MRFHHNLVQATVDALHIIFNEGKYADQAIQKILKRDTRWGSRDRGFIAETTYDIVRYKRLYAHIAGAHEPFNQGALWRMTSIWIVLKGHALPAWEEYYNTPERRIKGMFDEAGKDLALKESYPDWMHQMCHAELGEIWKKEAHALNQQAEVILRVNTLKADVKTVKEKLYAEEVPTHIDARFPDALILDERANVFATNTFKEGFIEVQDAGSQLIARFLNVEPGMRVMDACAGAGGKTLHLASLMQNKGQIIATDIYQSKLNELKRRSRRAGAHNIETRLIDSNKVIKKLHDKMDRLLIDAPCSGLGVLRRNPDAKWKLQPEFITEIRNTQATVLENYSKVVKPGGLLVYATCSILPSENHLQVAAFLTTESGGNFALEEDKTLLSHIDGFDGFYMARLKRKEA